MLKNVLESLDRRFKFERAKAHCDIPCKIYDPITSQIAVLTVIRMIDLMNELEGPKAGGLEYQNSMTRYINIKEEHAAKCKDEVRIIWGDYIKDPQIEAHPNVHTIVHNIMLLGSKVKQTADRKVAMELLSNVNSFAEIFWTTKDVKTKRVKAPYPPNEEVVYPVL